jgi:hypothetical protein
LSNVVDLKPRTGSEEVERAPRLAPRGYVKALIANGMLGAIDNIDELTDDECEIIGRNHYIQVKIRANSVKQFEENKVIQTTCASIMGIMQWDEGRAMAWITTPNKNFGYETPGSWITRGKAGNVLRFLEGTKC